MTSPDLLRMAERAALPISVKYYPELRSAPGEWTIAEEWILRINGALVDWTSSRIEASSIYLRLVSTLETKSASSFRGATAAADPASSSPGDAL